MRTKNLFMLVSCLLFLMPVFVCSQEVPCIPESRRVNWQNAGLFEEPNNVADNVININSYSGSDYDKIIAAINNSNYLPSMTIHSQNTEVDSSKIFKNMVFLGGNYSQFKTTDGVGKTGLDFGYFRQSRIWKQFYLNYGIIYTNIKLDLLDKTIRWSSIYEYSEDIDIHLNYKIIEFNILVSNEFPIKNNFRICPIFGVGYSFFGSKSTLGEAEVILQDDPVEEYDYACALTDMGGVLPKIISQIGIKLSIDNIFGLFTYTGYNKALEAAEVADIILKEKIKSFNLLFGVYF